MTILVIIKRFNATAGLTISQPSLQDLFIYLTGKEGEKE